MLKSDPDDVLLREVGPNGGETLADLIRFIRLRGTLVSACDPLADARTR